MHLARHQHPVLHGVSVTVRPCGVVALVGPNGAGKAAQLCRRAVTAVRPLRARRPGGPPYRRRVTPQRNRRAVTEAVAAVGAGTLMQREYRDLSGGERQRVQLARVLAQVWDVHWDDEPRYLLLDEPTARLGVGHQQLLLSVVRRVLPEGIGVLAVLHDLNLAAAFADRVCLLTGGRVLTAGAPADVIREEYVNQAYAGRFDVRTDLLTGRALVLASPPAPDDR